MKIMKVLPFVSIATLALLSVASTSTSTASNLPAANPTEFVEQLNQKLISSSRPPVDFPLATPEQLESGFGSVPCTLCKGLVSAIGPLVRANVTEKVIEVIAVGVCEVLRIDCKNPFACFEVCKGIIKEHAHEVIDIFASTVLSPSEACYILKMCPAPTPPPPPKPSVPVPSNITDRTGEHHWPSWDQKDGEGYFIHLSDIHLDLLYAAGTRNDCGEPLCCRLEDGKGTNASNTAGLWGDHQCDTSTLLLEDLFTHISSLNPPPDFILYTGDDPAHDVWMQSQASNTASITTISAMMVRHFMNIPVFSAIGNHEAYPVNQFQGPGFDSWLLDSLVLNWAHWLPEDAIHTLSYGGYFQARVRPGLRVISLNTNYYADGDFWLREKNYDFSNQLSWFNDTMEQIVATGDKVIIIGHGPTDGWEDHFAYPYLALVEKYQKNIINSFFGHTHANAIHLTHDNATSSIPFALNYVAGSVTPYQGMNQGYTMYTYDRAAIATDKKVLVDNMQQRWVDIDEVNKANATNWMPIQFDAKKDLNMKDLSLDSWQSTAEWVRDHNDDVYHQYLFSHLKGRVPSNPEDNKNLGCDMLTATNKQHQDCMSRAGVHNNKRVKTERCDVSKEKAMEMIQKKMMGKEKAPKQVIAM